MSWSASAVRTEQAETLARRHGEVTPRTASTPANDLRSSRTASIAGAGSRRGSRAEALAASVEPGRLLGRRFAAGTALRCRKRQARDDVAVPLRVVEHAIERLAPFRRRLVAQPAERRHRFLLHLGRLAVLQRHVEEHAAGRVERRVSRLLHAVERQRRQHAIVGGEGARQAAVDMPRGTGRATVSTQALARAVGPVVERAGGSTRASTPNCEVIVASRAARVSASRPPNHSGIFAANSAGVIGSRPNQKSSTVRGWSIGSEDTSRACQVRARLPRGWRRAEPAPPRCSGCVRYRPEPLRTRYAGGMAGPDELRVYWQPGCTSCLRTKGCWPRAACRSFPVNVLGTGRDGRAACARRACGAGDRARRPLRAQDLAEVARFVGLAFDARRLAPEVPGRALRCCCSGRRNWSR